MAFAQVATTATSNNVAQTNHTVTMPANIATGDLLIALFANDDNEVVTFPVGWTEIYEEDAGSQGPTLTVAWREADETEGVSITVTTGGAEHSSAVVYRITGAEDPDTQPPEVSAEGTGNSTAPDPPSLTPAGGAADFLWIAVGCNDYGPTTLSSYPAGYTDNQQDVSDDSVGDVRLYTATKEENDTSDDPASFTISESRPWEACTIAVHPAAAGGVEVEATTDALVLTEYGTTVKADTSLIAATDALVLTEYSATINAETSFTATTDALVLATFAATVKVDADVQAGVDALTLTEYTTTVKADISITATTDALVLTEYAATASAGVNVTATVDALTLTEYSAVVNAEISFTATTDALILATYGATVLAGGAVEVLATTDALILAEYAAVVTGVIPTTLWNFIADSRVFSFTAKPTVFAFEAEIITTNFTARNKS